jgi:hypothetical protein
MLCTYTRALGLPSEHMRKAAIERCPPEIRSSLHGPECWTKTDRPQHFLLSHLGLYLFEFEFRARGSLGGQAWRTPLSILLHVDLEKPKSACRVA